MEETRIAESSIDQIKPPRLEDAGLEDCALPPESIQEAFLKAASAVRSPISESDDEDESGDRVADDPWEDSSDDLAGITAELPHSSKGSAADAEEKSHALVSPRSPESEGPCVGGLEGLEIGEKSRGISGKKVGDPE